MIKKYSKIVGLILTVALLFTVAALITSCGDDNKISEIYVTKSDLPRTDYVEGQELDLSKGKLTVVTGGEESKIPLTAPEITVTGYDKDVVGEQVLTISYMELTTTITVNVAQRAVAQSYETKYFVGSEFNPNKGKIRITTDDAKSFLVNMNDETVSLVSFDSSTAGTATVTLLYNNGANSYYCQFDVTVYEQSNIEFFPPKQTEYLSHFDGKPNVYGGYFKVTSSDSTLTMNVPLTEDMIEGFDPSCATLANKETPLEQPVTVNYLGKAFNYNVYITYSSVSAVNYYASGELSKIDWTTAPKDGLTDEQNAAAIAAINEYYALTEEELALISDEVKTLIGRSAAIAVSDAFYTELAKYSNTIKIGTDRNIYFIKSSYEQTAADTKKLNDTEEKINVYAPLLRKIVADFGEVALTEEVLVKDFALVYSEETETAFKAILNHLVDVFTLVKDIPAEWDKESIKPFGDNILSAVMQIYVAGYYKNGSAGYYTSILSPWRENNDLFDIIYTYFVYDYENNAEFMANYMWGSMPLPGRLEDWYNGLRTCTNYSALYKNYISNGQTLVDVSPYMFNYFRTLEICEEIKNSGNQLWIDTYNLYNGDNMNRIYLYTYSYGYLYHTKAMVDSEAYHELWNKYYELLKLYNDQTLSAETHKAEICAMFDAFEALTPTELLGFLSSMSLMYTNGNGKFPMLGYAEATEEDEKNLVYNIFSLIVSNHYSSYLTETNKPLFNDLLSAMESFALINYKNGALEEFNAKMDALSKSIALLEGEDKTNFEEYFTTSYSKYYAIYEITSDKKTVELTEEETKIVNEYLTTINQFFTVYANVYTIIQNGYTVSDDVYPILYALYAHASELRGAILNGGNDAAILSMYATEYEINKLNYSLEKAYYLLDSITTSVLTSMSAIVSNADGTATYATYWDLYKSNGIEKLLSDNAYIFYSAYFTDGKAVEHKDLLAFMNEMRGFDTMKASIVVLLNIDDTFYKALSAYYKNVLTEEGLAVNSELIAAAQAYTTYSISKTEENLVAFTSAMEALKPNYEKLTEADKAYLKDTYDCYAGLLETLKDTAGEAEAA
ncbi:MAG: bacterial Ig-like domain-containing protein [Clostridia bacterium]|nr:bacterial Ig-like domain-containing protein [Clostridia bacterium]